MYRWKLPGLRSTLGVSRNRGSLIRVLVVAVVVVLELILAVGGERKQLVHGAPCVISSVTNLSASEAGANGNQVGALIISQGGGKESLSGVALVIVVAVASVLVVVVVVSVVVLVADVVSVVVLVDVVSLVAVVSLVVVVSLIVVVVVIVVSLVEGPLHSKEFHTEVINLHGHGITGSRCYMGVGGGSRSKPRRCRG